jgi:SPFH domain / Band 7 family
MNGTIQIDNHTGESATTVRLGNNSTAFVENSVRWRIQPAAADELFLDYREFENVRDNLVTRELRAALNEVFADFDPLAPENVEGANVQALGDDVAEKLRTKVGDQVEIINVIVPLVNYDDATQERINALNVEKANTRIAEQRAKTAEAEARANEILAASVSNDPNVLVSKCLDAAREARISPLGCWPGTAAVPTVPAR